MSTCRDCFHYEVCQYHIDEETKMTVNECDNFKDKSKIVELPCNVGDKIYFISGGKINEREICDIRYDFKERKVMAIGIDFISVDGGEFCRFVEYHRILTRYYFTKDEAEKALEKKQNGK